MAADASIYGLSKPTQTSPLEQYGQALNLRALMGQNNLQQLQTQKLTRDMEQEDAYQGVFRNAPEGATLESLLPNAMKADAVRGTALQGKVLENKKVQSELETAQLERTKKSAELHREQLADVNDPQTAAQWVKAGYSDPHLAPVLAHGGTVEQAIARIPTDPAQFQQWKERNGLGIQKFLEIQNTNREHGLNREVTTRGQDLSATTAREGHEITKRGQNMTDQRQRELNGILEGQSGVDITPTAKAIANYDIPLPPPPSGSRNPMALTRYNGLLAKVKELNPDYNSPDYQASQKAVKDFATGGYGQKIESANTAVNHLATLKKLALAQKNGDMQLFNKIANEYASQTGGTAPTDLKAAVTMVAPEIVKAVSGAGGGVEDRAKAASALNPNYSPDQMLGAIGTMHELFGGRLSETRRTYERTTKRKDFSERYLSPEARQIVESRKAEAPAAAAPAAVPAAKPGGLVASVKSDADFDKLPSGATFIAPDGTTRKKP